MTQDTKKVSHIPGVGITAAILVDLLKKGKQGDTLSDGAMSVACHRDTSVTGTGYGSLQTAIKRCEVDHGIVWRRQRKEGYIQCLSGSETLAVVDNSRKRMHRAGKRSVRQLATIDTKALPESERPAFNVAFAQMSTLTSFTATKTKKRLIAKAVSKPLDMAKLLEAI